MLGKLFKYELKETSRFLIPLLLSLVVLTIVNKIFFSINSQLLAFNLLKGICVFVLVSIDITIFVTTVVVIIVRFYKNFLGDEGYLMFTLPVKVSTHIIVKVLISTFWIVVSSSIVFLSMMFIFGEANMITNFVNNFIEMDEKFLIIIFSLEFIVLILVSIMFNILHVYTSISVGQLVQKHKILTAFGVYIAIYVAFQIIGTIILVILSGFGFFNSNININLNSENYSYIGHLFLLGLIGAVSLVNAGYYLVTKWILSNKLNLE